MKDKPYILLVDDDPNISRLVQLYLEKEGFEVKTADRGDDALAMFRKMPPDLMLLDVMLPGMDGWQVCRTIRKTSSIPIIMLTAKDETFDKVLGLELGADDYVTKPCSLAVLRARVNNLLRRSRPAAPVLELPPYVFDFGRMVYTKNGVPLDLSKTEQRLLRLLAEHRGQTLTREQLLDRVWDGGEFVDENALSVAVNRLRRKLGEAPIRTVYGVGYVWAEG